MHNKIIELAEQAGFYYTPKTGFITPAGCDPAKFAELIVAECIDVVSDCSVEYCTRPQIVSEIKQHFGVEL